MAKAPDCGWYWRRNVRMASADRAGYRAVTRASSMVSHMGLHDSDPRVHLRYVLVSIVTLGVVALLVVGFAALHALT
jgi:hypothetical protein